jgi:hypothetical protein
MIPLARFALARAGKASPRISFVDKAFGTGSGASITVPTIIAGDIGILIDWDVTTGGTPPTSVTPSGWTAIGSSISNTGSNSTRLNMSYKVLVSGDSGATLTGMGAADDTSKTLQVFRKTSGAWGSPSSINAQAVSGSATPSNQTVTVGTAPGLVIAGWMDINVRTNSSNATFSPAADQFFDNGLTTAYKIFNAAAVNESVQWGASLTPLQAMMVSFWLPVTAV